MEVDLAKRQVIEGKIKYGHGEPEIKFVHIYFKGDRFTTVEVHDSVFQVEITERFENGSYDVRTSINEVLETIGSFIVTNDKIDPTLPLDLQHLRAN